ncbi:putative virion structural protein [Salmonella phage SPAsTU]|nr:putative virion structural protein 14 [Salmonella phage STsAS]AWN08973.1 putative virion structural protein [Salmonella phage SPAsTU]
MTIRLSWPSQASKGLTAIEIYRKAGWNATLDVNNPGTPIATLSGTAVEFVDDIATLTKNTTYRYWVAGVKGTERLIGNPVTQGFFPDTGPGPQTLKRGDWACGYFGTLTNAEFFNRQELQLLLNSQQAGMFTADPATWHKFVFRGRILFFPATYHSNTNSVLMAYQRGMLYGTDDNGTIIPSGATATKQDCKVTKDGRAYRIRLPYAVPYDAAGSGQDYANGEWRNTFARLFPVSTTFSQAGIGSFDSLALLGSTTSVTDPGASAQAPVYSTGNYIYSYGYAPTSFNVVSGVNTAATLFFVFELVLP